VALSLPGRSLGRLLPGRLRQGGILGGVGPFHDVLVGGRGVIPLWWDLACLTVLGLAIFGGAMAQGGRTGSSASHKVSGSAT